MTTEDLTELAERVLPDSVACDLLPYYADELRKLVEAAVKAEREECAKLCDPQPGFKYSPNAESTLKSRADAIRARSNT